MALDIIGIKNVVIAQNKIDIVSREDAIKHYNQIKEFVKGTVAENAPIVPISAQQKVNIDVLIKTIEETIPTPKHDLEKPVILYVARSFDVNRPGTVPAKLNGGVIGGTISQGKLNVKDEIEIRPGRKVESENRETWLPITTSVTRLVYGGDAVDTATPGGLLAVGTKLDPAMTKSDGMAGQVVGRPGTLPPVWQKFVMKTQLLDRVVGVSEEEKVKSIATSEPLMLSVGTSMTIGVVTSARKDEAEVKLKRPVCAEVGSRIAISRRIGARWRLIGVGELVG